MICYKSLFILSKPLQHFDCMTFSFVRNINLFENKFTYSFLECQNSNRNSTRVLATCLANRGDFMCL